MAEGKNEPVEERNKESVRKCFKLKGTLPSQKGPTSNRGRDELETKKNTSGSIRQLSWMRKKTKGRHRLPRKHQRRGGESRMEGGGICDSRCNTSNFSNLDLAIDMLAQMFGHRGKGA